MTNTEKVAYIRGLTEGLELDTDKKEVKVINAIVDLLDDIALTLADIEADHEELADQLDAVDEDLGTLEEDFYGEEDDDEDYDAENEDDCYYEVTCPSCNETLCLSEDIIGEGNIDCPNCGENLEFDLESLDDDEEEDGEDGEHGCGCGCDHH